MAEEPEIVQRAREALEHLVVRVAMDDAALATRLEAEVNAARNAGRQSAPDAGVREALEMMIADYDNHVVRNNPQHIINIARQALTSPKPGEGSAQPVSVGREQIAEAVRHGLSVARVAPQVTAPDGDIRHAIINRADVVRSITDRLLALLSPTTAKDGGEDE